MTSLPTAADDKDDDATYDFDIDISEAVFLAWRAPDNSAALCVGELHYTNADWADNDDDKQRIFALVFRLQPADADGGNTDAWTFDQGDPFTLVDMNVAIQVYLEALPENDTLFGLVDAADVRAALNGGGDDDDDELMEEGWRCVADDTSDATEMSLSPRSTMNGIKAWLKAGANSAGWDLSRIPVADQTSVTSLTAATATCSENTSSTNLLYLDLYRVLGAYAPLAPHVDAEAVEARCHERTSLCAYLAWSVPTPAALDALSTLGPLLEVGAGTGYWATLLTARGVDIVAIDQADSQDGQAFRFRHAMVQTGNGVTALADPAHQHRSLLLSWPDPVGDDATTDSDRDSFGAACVAAFTGDTLAYIGELGPAVVRTKPGFGDVFPAGGSSASAALQEALRADFTCAQTVHLPNWPPYNAHLTIWTRTSAKAATVNEKRNVSPQGNGGVTKKLKR
jgi:hypothetical protein